MLAITGQKGVVSLLLLTSIFSFPESILTPCCAKELGPPSFVFFIEDDLGLGDVNFHGGNVPTPNLAKLLDEGT